MTWTLVIVLAVLAYTFKVTGMVLAAGRHLPPVVDRALSLIPAALIAALVVNDTLGSAGALTVDARAAGVGAAVVAAWRRAHLIVVIILGAAVTAAVRALGWLA